MNTWRPCSIRALGVPTAIVLALCMAGCSDHDRIQVQLHSSTSSSRDVLRLEIAAQVTGPQTGLHYKWFAVAGGCDPQASDRPRTSFKFADGTTRDRVSVDVWRDDKRIGRSEIDVKLDEVQARLAVMERPPEDVQINITAIPPYEPRGGPDTRADIAGKVQGKFSADYNVVLYARASDTWYIQPIAYAAHAIRPDNTWTSWTHTGSSYAALLVRPGFEPVPRLDMLPQVGGYVVARAIVEGTRK
jgi:hypothetical protein